MKFEFELARQALKEEWIWFLKNDEINMNVAD